MKTSRLLSAVALLAASAALAQNYTINTQVVPYSPLVGGTPVSWTIRSGNLGTFDEASAVIPLGFTFPYYGQNFTSVSLDSNGFLLLGGTPCTTSCITNRAIPGTTGTMHNIISPFWDDLDCGTSGAQVTTKSSGGVFEVEYSNVHPWGSTSSSFTVKVRLNASGMIEIHYGAASGSFSATNGFEDSTGAQGNTLFSCSTATNCTSTNWPTNTLYSIGTPVAADIVVPTVNISNLTVDAGVVSVTVSPQFRNFGQTPTGDFQWKAYLSSDKTLSVGTDTLIFSSTTPVNLGGATDAGFLATAQGDGLSPMAMPNGNYYVLVEADSDPNPDGGSGGVVPEASESNNVGSTTTYFVSGLDLVASSISGPAQSGPGNPMAVQVNWFNQGTDPAGTVQYRILLSTDQTFSTNDFVLYSASRTMTGGETANETVNFNVPGNVPGGDFYYLLQIDYGSLVTENKANNLVASGAKVTMKQADLVNEGADWLDPLTGASVRVGYFGSAARASVKVSNTGGANANNFKIGVVISTDSTLSLLSDTIVYEKDVVVINSGSPTQTVDIPFTLPSKDKNNNNFATGQYYAFLVLDSSGAVTELNEGNNVLVVSGPITLRAPAPDLAITRIDVPATGAVGEAIPVQRTFRNIGNLDAAAVKYRFFASANAIITVDDVPLPIISNGNTAIDGTVTLPIGATDQLTQFVKFPATMPAGTYYVGAILDSDGVVFENEESNNTLASATTVAVAPSSLRITTTQLPDAVVGRPYSYRLSAQGEQGGSTTWKIDTSQGTLPAGLTIAGDGLIAGTPTDPVVSSFTAIATNSARDAAARLVLRVLPTTTQVEITTLTVPPVVNLATQKYEFALGAAGGSRPYAWKLIGGALPQNLVLGADGLISGNPKPGLAEGVSMATVEVKDALGTSATRTFSFRVVAPGTIGFCPTPAAQCKGVTRIPDSLTGRDYGAEITIFDPAGGTIPTPTKLQLAGGALPEGLTGEQLNNQTFYVSGRPLKAGIYEFAVSVEDAKGRTATADFTIRVYPPRFSLSVATLPEILRPGDNVDFQYSTIGTSLPTTFTLYAGSLPPGVTMDKSGHVTGQVETENSEGNYNFVVEGRDSIGGTGLGAYNLVVQKEVRSGTCSASGSSLGLWLLMLLAPLVLRRRSARLMPVGESSQRDGA